MDLCSHKHDFGISAEWMLLGYAIASLPVIALLEQLKLDLAKQGLQRTLNNQVSDYKAIRDLCENEIISIQFFGICKESIISVENLETEK